MPRRFELLVFDWDGTLSDSTALIVQSLQNACRDLDLPVPTMQAARYVIGLGLDDTLAHVLPDLPRSEYHRLAERYRFHFLASGREAPLFDGIAAALLRLRQRNHRLAVATGKSRIGLDRALRDAGIETCFDATRCADESASKPDPAMLLQLMDRLDTSPEQTLMIGDTSHDLRMAANAGVSALAVAYGAHTREDLLALTPLACVATVSELQQWLTANA
jgi:phosphoglycolate phosphatase